MAVKDAYEANKDRAGLACSMKNAGVGVGLPDKGRAKAIVKDGMVELYTAASDIGQGCRTVFIQMMHNGTGLPLNKIKLSNGSTEDSPDSGTTSGSRQTLITGEAVKGVA